MPVVELLVCDGACSFTPPGTVQTGPLHSPQIRQGCNQFCIMQCHPGFNLTSSAASLFSYETGVYCTLTCYGQYTCIGATM